MTVVTTPRDDLGLTAAEDGDINGINKFISFIQNELSSCALLSSLPDPLCVRLESFAHDARLLSAFIDGYQAAVGRAKKP